MPNGSVCCSNTNRRCAGKSSWKRAPGSPACAIPPACVEDVNYQSPRGLDFRALFLKLAACDWIAERRNLLVTGASGLGKSWLACALGHKACRENMAVLYTRMPRLFADLAIAAWRRALCQAPALAGPRQIAHPG